MVHIGRDSVSCPHCGVPIVLPHQSPLGKFQSFDESPKGIWPADFLCPSCGRLYVCSDVAPDDEVPTMDPDEQIGDLLRVEYVDSPENSETRKIAYTTCAKGIYLKDVMPRIQRHLEGKTVWKVDRFQFLRVFPEGQQDQD